MTDTFINKITCMEDLQQRLPKGIKAAWINGKIHYTVRSSRKGKKVSLGTFLSIELATRALANFKADIPMIVSNAEIASLAAEEASRQAERMRNATEREKSQMPIEKMKELLTEVPTHLLDSKKPYKAMLDDGSMVIIPASVVASYFEALFSLESDGKDLEELVDNVELADSVLALEDSDDHFTGDEEPPEWNPASGPAW